MLEDRLREASHEDLEADTGPARCGSASQCHAPLRPCEEVLGTRWFMDREAYQAPSASFNVLTVRRTHHWLTRPRLPGPCRRAATGPSADDPGRVAAELTAFLSARVNGAGR